MIPGTLNVGHALPTIAQAFIFIAIVAVDPRTLIAMIAAVGARRVARRRRRRALAAARDSDRHGHRAARGGGAAHACTNLGLTARPAATALGAPARRSCVGLAGNFVLGALMTLGIGLYAPCMILVSLLGMNPTAAFPIMMGSCAFLMPVASVRFIARGSYDLRAALGLALGGIPAVLIAASS